MLFSLVSEAPLMISSDVQTNASPKPSQWSGAGAGAGAGAETKHKGCHSISTGADRGDRQSEQCQSSRTAGRCNKLNRFGSNSTVKVSEEIFRQCRIHLSVRIHLQQHREPAIRGIGRADLLLSCELLSYELRASSYGLRAFAQLPGLAARLQSTVYGATELLHAVGSRRNSS